MDDNTTKVWLAAITTIGTVAGTAITYLIMRVQKKLNTNTAITTQTHNIVNSEREAMKKEMGELRDQLTAVTAALEMKKKTHESGPAVVQAVKNAIEAVKEEAREP